MTPCGTSQERHEDETPFWEATGTTKLSTADKFDSPPSLRYRRVEYKHEVDKVLEGMNYGLEESEDALRIEKWIEEFCLASKNVRNNVKTTVGN